MTASPAVFLAVTTCCWNLHAAEFTSGEKAVRNLVGRDIRIVRLWPGGAGPDGPEPVVEETIFRPAGDGRSLRIQGVSRPSLMIFAAPGKQTLSACVMLCPGVRDRQLDVGQMLETAAWLNGHGIHAAILKHRVSGRGGAAGAKLNAVQDAQRALCLLRARAAVWQIDFERIGTGGFFSGGCLAAVISGTHASRSYRSVDPTDQTSCRPDFALLVSPEFPAGPVPAQISAPLLKRDSGTAGSMPPVFLAITEPDRSATRTVRYALGLREAGVKFELHMYPDGRHGETVRKHESGEWKNEFHRWLSDIGVVPGAPRQAAFHYRAGELPGNIVRDTGLTEADQRLRLILGRECPVIPVWPDGTGPDETLNSIEETVSSRSRGGKALNIRQVTRPTLTVVRPQGDDRPRDRVSQDQRAVIVCPGGGYGGLAAEHEGTRVCEWLNESGVTAFLLKYRVPRRGGQYPKHHHALQDIQRAVRIVRSHAARFRIDPDRIGVLGFSAGGHLATTLCTNWKTDSYSKIDDMDGTSCRPDFGVLIYPAYLTDPVKSDTVDRFCADGLDRQDTPPLFLAIARDDVFARGMLNFSITILDAEVPFECHVFGSGGHGGGLDPDSYPCSEWTKSCRRWLGGLASERTVP